jgi:WhiB family redox-sensing transcriptional regulator
VINGSTDPKPMPAFRLDPRVRCTPAMADLFFPLRPSAEVNEQVREFCRPCPVRLDCLQYGLDHEPDWGIFGGLDPAARRREARMRALHGRFARDLETVA